MVMAMVVLRLVAPIPRVNLRLGRGAAEVEARADDPDEQKDTDNRTNDDSCNGAAGQICRASMAVGCAGDGDSHGGGRGGGGLSGVERNGP